MSIKIDNNIFFFQKQKIYNFLYIKMYLVCSLTTDMIYTIAIYMFKCITTVGKSLNSSNSLSSDWSKTFHS